MGSSEIILVSSTAFLSALLTIGFSFLMFRFYLKQLIVQELGEFAVLLKQKLREGVKEAGQELLPDFRIEVREGFMEAMRAATGGQLIEKTAENLAKTSTNFMETGFNILFGKLESDRK